MRAYNRVIQHIREVGEVQSMFRLATELGIRYSTVRCIAYQACLNDEIVIEHATDRPGQPMILRAKEEETHGIS